MPRIGPRARRPSSTLGDGVGRINRAGAAVDGRRRRAAASRPHLHAHRAGQLAAEHVHRRRRSARTADRRTAGDRRPRSGRRARSRARRGSAASPDRSRRRARSAARRPARASAGCACRRSSIAVGRRDRVAVRIARRVAELGRDQLLELLGEDVLEHLGLVVHAVPRHAELLGEVQLEQPVVAQHLERDAPARRRSAARRGRARARRARARRACLTIAEADAGRDAEALGERVRRDGAAAAPLERVDRLRVVLDGEVVPCGTGFAPIATEIMAHLKDVVARGRCSGDPGYVELWPPRPGRCGLPGADRGLRAGRPLRARQARAHRAPRRRSSSTARSPTTSRR